MHKLASCVFTAATTADKSQDTVEVSNHALAGGASRGPENIKVKMTCHHTMENESSHPCLHNYVIIIIIIVVVVVVVISISSALTTPQTQCIP